MRGTTGPVRAARAVTKRRPSSKIPAVPADNFCRIHRSSGTRDSTIKHNFGSASKTLIGCTVPNSPRRLQLAAGGLAVSCFSLQCIRSYAPE